MSIEQHLNEYKRNVNFLEVTDVT